MKLSNALAAVKPSSEKTAAATTGANNGGSTEKVASTPAVATERLKEALKEAAVPAPQTEQKTAAAGTPVDALTKVAGEVLSLEQQTLLKEAQMYGTTMADAFLARLGEANTAAAKIAAAQPAPVAPVAQKTASDDSFEKFAAENPALVKEAMALGYERTMDQLEKLANTAYERGYNDTVTAIYKTGHAVFMKGYEDTARLLQEIQK